MVANPAFFRGDSPHLIDALVEASQKKPASNPVTYGRELVPWCSDEDASSALLNMPLEQAGRRQHSKFPAPQQPHAAAAGAAAAAAAAALGNNKRTTTNNGNGNGRRMSAEQRTATRFACPAVAASPKPEALPMPTGLMSRAARSRSPSPPKDGFFAANHAALARVRAVAA